MNLPEWRRKVRAWLDRNRVDCLAIFGWSHTRREMARWDKWLKGVAKSGKLSVLAKRNPPDGRIEAEFAVLGAMILNPACIDIVCRTLKARHFFRPPHRALFRLLTKMHAAGKRIDLATLRDELRDLKKAQKVGGLNYVVSLAEIVADADRAEYYARAVRNGFKKNDIGCLRCGV